MEKMEKATTDVKAEIKGRKLVMTLSNSRQVEIDLLHVEHLLEWNVAKHCENVILSFAQMSAYLLQNQEYINLKGLLGFTPDPDIFYFLDLVAKMFKGEPFITNENNG